MGTRRLGCQPTASVVLSEEQLPEGSLLDVLCVVDAASIVRMCLVATSPSIVGMFTSCKSVNHAGVKKVESKPFPKTLGKNFATCPLLIKTTVQHSTRPFRKPSRHSKQEGVHRIFAYLCAISVEGPLRRFLLPEGPSFILFSTGRRYVWASRPSLSR